MFIEGDEVFCDCGGQICLDVVAKEVHNAEIVDGEVRAGKWVNTYSFAVDEAFCPRCGKSWPVQEVQDFIRREQGLPPLTLGDFIPDDPS